MTVESCDMGSPPYTTAVDRGSLLPFANTIMDHPNPLVPDPVPDFGIRHQIATLGRWLENLLSFICIGVLMLIPVLFAVAHIAADGAAWNFATGEKFSPMFNVVSSYAWRSQALMGSLLSDQHAAGCNSRIFS